MAPKKSKNRIVHSSSKTGRFVMSKTRSTPSRNPHNTTTSWASRKIHIAPPSSASEIRNALGVSPSDLKAALDALDD